jgi:glycosyltransferase involved in cell wall biosynthesis
MNSERGILLDRQNPVENPYLFLRPENLLSPDDKERLSETRLGILAPPWIKVPPDEYGGIEDVIFNFLRSKAASYFKQIDIIGHPDNSFPRDKFPNVNAHVIDLPEIDYATTFQKLQNNRASAMEAIEIPYVSQAYAAFAQMGLDVVHDHTILGRKFANQVTQQGIPVLQLEHGPVMGPDLPISQNNIYETFQRDRLHWSLAISDDQRERNPSLNWLDVIPNGVNVTDFTFHPLKKGLPDIGQYGLYLGRINRDKGLHNAMDTAEELKMPLIIAGHFEQTPDTLENYEPAIMQRIAGNTKLFKYFNRANNAERKMLMSRATWFASLIEWNEPFGLTNAESLASGTIPVGTRRGALPDIIVPGTGILVDDPREAPDAIREYLEMSALQKLNMALRGRRHVELNFSTDIMSSKLAITSLKAIGLALAA